MGSKTTIIARKLDASDQAEWDRLASSYGTVFDSIKWTRMFEPRLQRVGLFDGGDNLRGGFCIYEQRRFGLRILRNPPFTPQIGPFYESRATNPAARTDEQRAVVEAMADYVDTAGAAVVSMGLSLGIDDCLPFCWRDYKVVPRYTYRITLQGRSQDEIWKAMSNDRRKNVRRAKKDGLLVEELQETNDIARLVDNTFARQKKSFPRNAMRQLLTSFPKGEKAFGFVSKRGKKPIGGVYVIHDEKTAYYLLGGYKSDSHHGAGALAMVSAIERARELGLEVFDFEGSVIPPIEKYFRGFGGALTPAFTVNKAFLPLEMGLKLKKRRLF